jgi:UDP-2,3-diacylglucosamine hydrolase
MKPTLFISDLHLSDQRPDLVRAFFHFLDTQARDAEALYILGDLFDFWLGDDDDDDISQQVTGALQTLHQTGVKLFFLQGNRDFLVASGFAKLTGCALLDEETVIDLYGTPTLLMHGDTLCTDDVKYLEFRRKVQNPITQFIFRLLPLSVRKKIFYKVKTGSKTSQQQKSAMIMDVTEQAVIDVMQKHQVTRLIHGHTHRPTVHPATEKHGERIVLGDWDQNGWYLQVDADSRKLEKFAI